MRFSKVIKMFRKGNVCVTGLRGDGKDMLMANVVCRRKLDYISNVVYLPELHHDFVPSDFDCGGNIYRNFIEGNLNTYTYKFPDGVDIYISDAGIYFPAQYCNELNKYYGHFSTFMALSRHLGDCNVHINVQNLNRAWDKLREQSDLYIRCEWCKVLFGKIVIQKITIYEKYQSCVDRVPTYRVPAPLFDSDRIQRWKIDKQKYECSYGKVKSRLLVYVNRSNYDTRIFKEVLSGAKK